MAETLGEAVLDLRTDDSAFTAGVNKAEAAATGLGKTLDMASGSAVELAGELDAAATSGNRGAQAFLKAGAAIDALAAAQVQAKVETDNAKAALNAGTIGLEQYNREVLQTKSALALLEEEHRKAQVELRQTLSVMGQTTGASGAQRAGLTQLTQQLGDMSTMYALGMRPQQIFASQIGQVTGAVQLLAGEGSKFARFLGGPWGIAVMVAVQVLGPLIGNLLSTEDAMEKVKVAANNLSDVQGALGKVFDLTTGKIKDQTEATMGLARATLELAKAQAQKNLAEANRTVAQSGQKQFQISGGMGGGFSIERVRPIEGQIESQFRNGMITATQAMDKLESLYKRGKLTQERFLELNTAYAGTLVEAGNVKNADDALKDLKDGKLSAQFRQPGPKRDGGRKNSAGKTEAEIDAEYLQDSRAIDQDELQARMQLATSAEDRADIAYQMLGEQRTQREAEIDANKDYSEAQKKALKAKLEVLYGKESGEPGVLDLAGGLLNRQIGKQQREEEARLANDMLARQAQTLEAWSQVSTSSEERARLEAEALKLQQQIQTNLLEQQIATGQVADGEKARAELRSQQSAAREGLAQRNAGPLDAYVAGLRSNKEESGRRVEQLVVDELDWVHQSITNSISSRLGVKDPFLKGLIDMFVQDVLIRPFAEALQNARGGGGGGGGIFGSLFKVLGSALGGGASPQASLAGSASATINDPAFAGLFASGGTIPAGGWGIVGEAGPEPVFATGGGVGVLPNSALRGMQSGSPPAPVTFDLRGAVLTQDLLQQMNQISADNVRVGLTGYDHVVGDRVKEHLERRG